MSCFQHFCLNEMNTALQTNMFCEKAPTHPQVSLKEVEKLLDISPPPVKTKQKKER